MAPPVSLYLRTQRIVRFTMGPLREELCIHLAPNGCSRCRIITKTGRRIWVRWIRRQYQIQLAERRRSRRAPKRAPKPKTETTPAK